MKFKFVYIIHGLILSLFILSALYGYNKLIELNKIMYSQDLNYYNLLDITITHKVFRPLIILILPTIGVFMKNIKGWVLTSSYFYYLIWSLFFVFFEDGIGDFNDILLFVLIFSFIIVLIVIMNLKRVSFDYYRIKKNKLMGLNLISLVIGFCIFLLTFISINHFFMN